MQRARDERELVGYRRVVAGAKTANERLDQHIVNAARQQIAAQYAAYNEKDLSHRLIVFHNQIEEAQIHWYPNPTRCKERHQAVEKQGVAAVEPQQQIFIQCYDTHQTQAKLSDPILISNS